MKQAIILASGGLDSFVMACQAKNQYDKLKILFFDYGQKALKEELFCVSRLARELKSEFRIIDLGWLGRISTSFINKNKKTCKDEIIKWYVPCRNSVFLASALAVAESDFLNKNLESDILIGIKHEGEISFNDTKPIFLKKINELASVSVQAGKFQIIAPFINKDKEDIIELAEKEGIRLEKSYSCYLGAGFSKNSPVHCGKCGGCLARKKGFKFSSVKDLSIYKEA